MSRLKINDIKKDLEERGWKLLSEEYQNLDSILEFQCPEGHHVLKSYKQIRRKYECPICKKNPLNKINQIDFPPKKDCRRLLALDQATIITGWALYDDEKLINYGIYNANQEENLNSRLVNIKQWLVNIVELAKPDIVVFEDIQLQEFEKRIPNQKKDNIGLLTYKALAKLIGVLECLLTEMKIEYYIVPSSVWRSSVNITGRSRSDKKKNAQIKVKQWYDIRVSEDEADAICIGRHGSKAYSKKTRMIKW